MSITTSPELFINMKRIPDKTSREYKPFFKEEKKKIKEGITINGTLIPGWLYWHFNHWWIDVDMEPDPITKYVERKKFHPFLRDNEWLIGEAIHNAEQRQRGLLILGSRQLGKSEFGASYVGRRALNFKNTQNVLAGLSTPDLELLASKIERGFNLVHEYFRPIKAGMKDNWSKQVDIGYKDTSGKRILFSEILIRNLDDGKNSENLAGPTTSSLLLDEVGKNDFLAAFTAVKPAIQTPYGWRCSPIFTGTSGAMGKSTDLQTFYGQLESFNFDCVHLLDHTGKPIRFIPGWMASRSPRKKIRLSTFLGLPKGSELDIVPIRVVKSVENAMAVLENEREILRKGKKKELYNKEVMYYPTTEEELFLVSDDDNPFADIKQLALDQLMYLDSIDDSAIYGFMTRDVDGKPKFVETKDFPISTFPTEDWENKDAPIQMWDHCIPGQPFGILHCAGGDPYNKEESDTSPSLGAIYIQRRTYDPLKGRFQECIVASYTARPKNMAKFHEQTRLLLEYYGATILPENADTSLIRYFDNKNLNHYVEDGLDLAKELNPNTKAKTRKGLSPSPANIKYGNGLIKSYFEEDIVMGMDANDEPIIKKGAIRVRDKMLLKEIIDYKEGVNVDRIVAWRHALILAAMKDKFYPIAKVQSTEAQKKIVKPPRSPFGATRHAWGSGRKSGPFSRR